jgi:poly(hydroxyalkanoate) granule-associated protein
MARKTKTRTSRNARTVKATPFTPANALAIARESAQKAIGTIVKQGAALRAASQKAAMARANAAKDAANAAREAAMARAEEARAKTVEAVSQLERVFEQRVSRAISKLGVPTTKDVRALSRQVAQLQASVDRLNRSRSRASA